MSDNLVLLLLARGGPLTFVTEWTRMENISSKVPDNLPVRIDTRRSVHRWRLSNSANGQLPRDL